MSLFLPEKYLYFPLTLIVFIICPFFLNWLLFVAVESLLFWMVLLCCCVCYVFRLLEIFLLLLLSLPCFKSFFYGNFNYFFLIFPIVLTFVFSNNANIFDNVFGNLFLSLSMSVSSSKSSCTNSAMPLKKSKATSAESLLLFSCLLNCSIWSVSFANNSACSSWLTLLKFSHMSSIFFVLCCLPL